MDGLRLGRNAGAAAGLRDFTVFVRTDRKPWTGNLVGQLAMLLGTMISMSAVDKEHQYALALYGGSFQPDFLNDIMNRLGVPVAIYEKRARDRRGAVMLATSPVFAPT